MDFAAAVKDGLVNAFNFKGTASRKAFWYFYLFNWIISQVIQVIDLGLNPGLKEFYASAMVSDTETIPPLPDLLSIMPWASLIATLVLFVPNLSITFRRLHDSGRNGKLALLQFLPLILAVAVFAGAFALMANPVNPDPTLAVLFLLGALGLLGLAVGWFVLWIIWMVAPTKTAEQGNRYANLQ